MPEHPYTHRHSHAHIEYRTAHIFTSNLSGCFLLFRSLFGWWLGWTRELYRHGFLLTSTWAAALGRVRATELAAKRNDRSDMFSWIQWSFTKKWRPHTDLSRTRVWARKCLHIYTTSPYARKHTRQKTKKTKERDGERLPVNVEVGSRMDVSSWWIW